MQQRIPTIHATICQKMISDLPPLPPPLSAPCSNHYIVNILRPPTSIVPPTSTTPSLFRLLLPLPLSSPFNNRFNYNPKWYTNWWKTTQYHILLGTNCKAASIFLLPLSLPLPISTHANEPNHGRLSLYHIQKPRKWWKHCYCWCHQYQYCHFPTTSSLSLSLFCNNQLATLQNCTYHKVLRSAANKSVPISVSKET